MLSGGKSGILVLNTAVFTAMITPLSSRDYVTKFPASVDFQLEYEKSITNLLTCKHALVQSTWQKFKILDSSYPITHDKNQNEKWTFSGEFNPGTCHFQKFTFEKAKKCLYKSSIYFIGDSRTRQIYRAAVQISKNENYVWDFKQHKNILTESNIKFFWSQSFTGFPAVHEMETAYDQIFFNLLAENKPSLIVIGEQVLHPMADLLGAFQMKINQSKLETNHPWQIEQNTSRKLKLYIQSSIKVFTEKILPELLRLDTKILLLSFTLPSSKFPVGQKNWTLLKNFYDTSMQDVAENHRNVFFTNINSKSAFYHGRSLTAETTHKVPHRKILIPDSLRVVCDAVYSIACPTENRHCC